MEFVAQLQTTSIPVIIARLHALDALSTKTGRFTTADQTPFSLGEFVSSNLLDHEELSPFSAHTHCILWSACCDVPGPDTTMLRDLLGLPFPLVEPKNDALLVVLGDFVAELTNSLIFDFPPQDRIDQLRDFAALIDSKDSATPSPGLITLRAFKERARGLSYLPLRLFALPFFLQVHHNYNTLVDHSYLSRVCRNAPTHVAPTVRDWIGVVNCINASPGFHSSLAGESNPQVLKHFSSLFQDQSVPIHTRCLQLFTIYHAEWERIWTLVGWKGNRIERATVLEFKHDFTAPFYQVGFLDVFFKIFMSIG